MERVRWDWEKAEAEGRDRCSRREGVVDGEVRRRLGEGVDREAEW